VLIVGVCWRYAHATEEQQNPFRLDLVAIYGVLYEISTPHGTTVAGIECFLNVNGDTWATTHVDFYSATPSVY
jgi:hypothetical protein